MAGLGRYNSETIIGTYISITIFISDYRWYLFVPNARLHDHYRHPVKDVEVFARYSWRTTTGSQKYYKYYRTSYKYQNIHTFAYRNCIIHHVSKIIHNVTSMLCQQYLITLTSLTIV